MQHLEGSGTPVLYIGRMVLKGYWNNYIRSNFKMSPESFNSEKYNTMQSFTIGR
jgi:hypothetical protein